MPDRRPLRTYGRTKARGLKPRQAALVDTLLPHLELPATGAIDVEALFSSDPREGGATEPGLAASLVPPAGPRAPSSGDLVLEIGFGGGEHLVAQALAAPGARFMGVEPFLNGVASCLRHIEDSGAANIRLHQGDARDVVARLPDACLHRVFILFPDPWPKARHHKRRLIQPEFVDELARVMKPGADIRFATDWAHYAAWTLEAFGKNRCFTWTAKTAADWRTPWAGHVATRYEAKRLGDCAPVYLQFVRQPALTSLA